MRFDYQGAGWSRLIITDEAGSREFTASHAMGDPMDDLLRVIADLAEGAREVRCRFCEEPGEYRWLFQCLPKSDILMVMLRIVSFSDCFKEQRDELGIEEYEIEIPLIDLCLAARSMARVAEKEFDRDPTYLMLLPTQPDRLDRFLSRGT